MAYSSKVKAKAKKLYIVDGLSYEKVAKELKVKSAKVVFDWSHSDPEGEWIQKRNEMTMKVNQIAEQNLAEEYGIDKATIKKNIIAATNRTLEVTNALIQFAQDELIDPVTKKLKPDALKHPHFAQLFNVIRIMEPRVVNSAKAQDDIVFNKNKIDINADINIDAAGLYSAIVHEAESTRNQITGRGDKA